jgi:hypothetical protein
MHALVHRGACAGAQDFKLPPGETAPLLVKIHGGPTSAAGSSFSLGIQYWTSRGAPRLRGLSGRRAQKQRLWWNVCRRCLNAAGHCACAGRQSQCRACY